MAVAQEKAKIRSYNFSYTNEVTNHLRLFCLLDCIATEIFRELFDHYIQPHTLNNYLSIDRVKNKLKDLKREKILTEAQFQKLYRQKGKALHTSDMDITLMQIFFRNIFSLPAPDKGWEKQPGKEDESAAADIFRLNVKRKQFCNHPSKISVNDEDFQREFSYIKTIILRLQTQSKGQSRYDDAIFEIERGSIDPRLQARYDSFISQHVEKVGAIMENLDNTREDLRSEIKLGNDSIEERLAEIQAELKTLAESSGPNEQTTIKGRDKQVKLIVEKIDGLTKDLKDTHKTGKEVLTIVKDTDETGKEKQIKEICEKLDEVLTCLKDTDKTGIQKQMKEMREDVDELWKFVKDKFKTDCYPLPTENAAKALDEGTRQVGTTGNHKGTQIGASDEESCFLPGSKTLEISTVSIGDESSANGEHNPLSSPALEAAALSSRAVFQGAQIDRITIDKFYVFQGNVTLTQDGKVNQAIKEEN